ncbi:MAG: ABC transporter substrate-binding protein [Lachnospiraceae bacterium]|nr:ABC transporter substrate-binding protein [Lachnospiraceae bacterium]
MGKIYERAGAVLLVCLLLFCGCGKEKEAEKLWPSVTAADTPESPKELYEKALKEDVLIVYTVSTRTTKTKESFEKAYPGLSVEIRDLRSPNLIEAVEENAAMGLTSCDVVICNDNSGDFKARLVDTGLVVPYLPADIAPHMKENSEDVVTFLNEAEILLYNSAKYDSCPVTNLWALEEPEYAGRIYMPNPLRSFSTYAFCGAVWQNDEALSEAYRHYTGTELSIPEGKTASQLFWERVSKNMVFTNSSDEVAEALQNGDADLGIAVSSKLRLKDVGYQMEAAYRMDPFCGCRTSFAVMLAKDSENINTARLFIRYLLGEADGRGEGILPFCTEGTWSARDDIPDANPVPLSETDLIIPDQERLIKERESLEAFWTRLLMERNPGNRTDTNL